MRRRANAHARSTRGAASAAAAAEGAPAVVHAFETLPGASPYFDNPLDSVMHVNEVMRAHPAWASAEFLCSVDDNVLIAGSPYPYVAIHRFEGTFGTPVDLLEAHADFSDGNPNSLKI